MSFCKVDGCNEVLLAKGYCSKHYWRFKKHGDPLFEREISKGKPCTIEGCCKPIVGKGFCAVHYGRWRRHGDPLKKGTIRDVKTGRMIAGEICKAAGCNKPRYSKGYCQNHYYRFWKHGAPTGGRQSPMRKRGEGTKNNGYHFTSVIVNGVQRQVGTHRLVMEQKLGRKLRKNENVHHINGIRDDNKPENLELWVSSQPSGQRPQDLVEWARNILETYGDEVDRVHEIPKQVDQ